MQGICTQSPGRFAKKISNKLSRFITWSAVLVALVTPTKRLIAAETTMTVRGGAYVTSNGNQSSTPVSDLVGTFTLTGTYKNKTPRLDADIEGTIEGRFFSIYGDSLLPSGTAKVNAVLWKERLDWYLQDRMEVVRIDALSPDIKSNQEIANVIITGPTGLMRFGPRNRLIGEIRAENSTFQTSTDKNSDKLGGALRWMHDISPVKLATAEIEAQTVRGVVHYQKYKGFVTYQQTRPRGMFTGKAGPTLIRNYFPSDYQANEYSLDYVHRINTRSGWTLSTGKSLSDTSEALVKPLSAIDPLTRDAGLFINRETSLGYTYAYAEDSAIAAIFHRERDYLSTAISENSNGASGRYYMRTGRSSGWEFTGLYLRTEYSDLATPDSEYEASAEYGYDINKELTWKMGVLGRARRSAIVGRSFDEYVVSTYLELKRRNVHH